ncbi:MAG: ferritin family protein [Deltaproteobacteria bacterium]|nr:ferritin family protein [Deltaproteobacteria bacterium]
MKFESIAEVIEFAKEKEQDAADFYEEVSKLEVFSGSRELLEGFAKEERKHYDLLDSIGKNNETLSDYKFEWVHDLKRSNYMVDITYEKGMTYPDLLRLAMKREEKALKLYNEMAQQMEHEDYLNMFKMLSQEEAKHKNILETLYDDYMAGQGD